MLELRHLRHALALGKYRNFARAAEALHLTQPSLSRSIAALERELGVRLFDRAKNGVRPTAFGELLLGRGAALLDGEAEFRREIQLLAGLEAGTLRIGAGPYPAEISVGVAVARLIARHPRLRVEVLCSDPDEIARRVLAGQFDVGIGSIRVVAETARMRFEPLPVHRVYLACRPGHPLAGRRGLGLGDVTAYPLATTVLPSTEGTAAADGSGMGRFDLASGLFLPSVHVNSLALARQIASGSDALFPATATMLAADSAAGRLVALDFDAPYLRTDYGIATLADRSPAPAMATFLELLRQAEAEAVEAESAAAAPVRAVGARPKGRAREQRPPGVKGAAQ
jgi:DNA-binding transcriptional LysR family regulator